MVTWSIKLSEADTEKVNNGNYVPFAAILLNMELDRLEIRLMPNISKEEGQAILNKYSFGASGESSL